MKKLIFLLLVSQFIGFSAATVTIQINSAGWGDDQGTGGDVGLVWGIVINSNGVTFDANTSDLLASELVGFIVPGFQTPSDPISIGTSGLRFARAQTNSGLGLPPTSVPGNFAQANFSLTNGVDTEDAVGLLWFRTGTTSIGQGTSFGYVDLQGTVPADAQTVVRGQGITPTTMQFTTVPEPAALGLGLFGLSGLLARRRRD